MGCIEMVDPVTCQGLPLFNTRTHSTGARVLLTPIGPQVQTGFTQTLVRTPIPQKLHGNAPVIRQQQHITQLCDIHIQLLNAGPSHVEKFIDRVLMLPQGLMSHDPGTTRLARVQSVLVNTSLP